MVDNDFIADEADFSQANSVIALMDQLEDNSHGDMYRGLYTVIRNGNSYLVSQSLKIVHYTETV